MDKTQSYDIFLMAPPGLEQPLAEEASECGFAEPRVVPGGVETRGPWSEVMRANLVLRGAGRVLVRIGGFPAVHLAQLDKRARKFAWGDFLRADVPVRVEAVSRKSKIYHAGAAKQRIERAITEELGAPISDEADIRLMLRIERDFCTFSIDTSGEALHKRGHKEAVGKAPMRETMAALFLRQCGFDGAEPVLDPMCGSGSFVIEAAEWAAGLAPGRTRSFAFEQLAGFDAARWQALRAAAGAGGRPESLYCGSDRNAGAIEASRANATRAGVSDFCAFHQRPVSDIRPPEGRPGLVIVNPPYGARIGDQARLRSLYGSLGKVLMERFSGWRVGLITSEMSLARATRLPFQAPGPVVDHGGIKVRLYQSARLR
ncbi:class I SAM-dependent RNA methyltransferase [Ruegeria pomeroyi]|uniref:Class I SAM-dependent RNA methyltransferase n=1 Tax=Ruegeria alba TaxID=2916756 RepID=A0ABS9P2E2_9RHOB|nr:class I SAM-dependent RNA methyltransferase [Ruegeria alba]MCE8514710.1 class I SAM-dependent RNA methyltransferase [Ruegeria pomeroyi]MCE8522005.1 class I SAM-dependent RNA methyltransferase [Ruegeria pomeroyi]MCE8531430.1 class I SAM-dependent RNA methyltransferase [Ruegeria pomeroyi]MCG6560117.1 class I SAM-dependent RNA methyltransferase [Ruegeria alba]